MKTNKHIIIASIIGLVLTLNLVIAFSPISGYSQQTPLNLYPGEEKEAIIHIYPTPEEGTINVEATIIEGMNIASITDESNIYASSSTKDGVVHIKVSVPSTATIGSEYIVKSRFVDKAPKSTTGTVGFAIESINTFKVVVVEKPLVIVEEEAPQEEGISLMKWIIGIIIVVAIMLIIYLILKKKNG